MKTIFDMIMGEPTYGGSNAGDLSLAVTLTSLAVILAMILKLHLQKITSDAIFHACLLAISFVAGRIYLYYYQPSNVNILPSDLAKSAFFKISLPICIYSTCVRLESIKFLNQSQLSYILIVGVVTYIISFTIQTLVMYSFTLLCFEWRLRTIIVLSVAITMYSTQNAIELLESKGGHVKYLQAALKAEVIWDIMVSYTVVEILLKNKPMPFDYTPADVAKLIFRCFLCFCGIPYGILIGLAILPLFYFSFGHAKVSPLVSFVTCIFVFSSASMLLLSGCAATSGFATATTVLYKPKMMESHEKFMKMLWQLISVVCIATTSILGGFMIGCSRRELDIKMFCFAFGIFAISMMVRLLVIFFVFPLLNEKAPKWTELSLVVVGPLRGIGALMLGMWYSTTDGDEEFQILIIIVLVLTMSLFTNVIMINWIVERLDIFHLSKAQISNMNVAVDQINKCRGNMIFAEKLDRFIADANWAVVSKITSFNHPYQHRVRTIEFAESFKEDVKTVQCPRCGKWTVAPPTRKEVEEVTRETKLRVMKAQQVSFIKQREAGTLTIFGYKFLSNLVYQASYTDEISVDTDELRILAEDLKCAKKMQAFFTRIFEMTEETYEWQPTNKIRLKCYHITISQGFRIGMAIVSLLDMFLCLSFVFMYAVDKFGDGDHSSTIYLGRGLSILFPLFYLMNLCEALIQFMGVGIRQYFSKTVYKIEFLSCVIMRSLQVFVYLYECAHASNYLNLAYTSPPMVYLNVMLWLRITRFYIFFVAVIPSILKRIQETIDRGYLKKYDIGKAYLVGLDRVLKYLGQLTTNQHVREEIKKEIENNRQKVTKELGMIQKEHPNIAITVKTKHAIRHVVNSMQECSEGMQSEGILDMIEANALLKSVNSVRLRLYKLHFIVPPLPINILKEISWLQGDEENTELFLSRAMMYNYDYNDYLIRNGDDPVGLYILVSGLLKATYCPSSTTIGLAHKFGVLPCYDFFENFKFDQPQEEFIVSGNVIGELGLVTGRRYDMTVMADTAVQTYFIPDQVMKSLHLTYSGRNLLAKIWKKVAIRISTTLLQFTNTYRSWSQEKLLTYLQKGVLPDLTGVVALNLDAKVEEAILIQGVAQDAINQSIIYGPYRIPKTVSKLLLPDHSSWRFQTVYDSMIFLVLASGASATDLLETYTEPEEEPEPEESKPEEKKKKQTDKSRKVGFASDDGSQRNRLSREILSTHSLGP